MDKATIERLPETQAWGFSGIHKDEDSFLSTERAGLPCGCSIYIGSSFLDGVRTELGSRAMSCSDGHDTMIKRAVELQVEGIPKPEYHGRPAVEVAAEMLERAWEELDG